MKHWFLKQLGILKAINKAELAIIENVSKLNIDPSQQDEITDIVMTELNKIRR